MKINLVKLPHPATTPNVAKKTPAPRNVFVGDKTFLCDEKEFAQWLRDAEAQVRDPRFGSGKKGARFDPHEATMYLEGVLRSASAEQRVRFSPLIHTLGTVSGFAHLAFIKSLFTEPKRGDRQRRPVNSEANALIREHAVALRQHGRRIVPQAVRFLEGCERYADIAAICAGLDNTQQLDYLFAAADILSGNMNRALQTLHKVERAYNDEHGQVAATENDNRPHDGWHQVAEMVLARGTADQYRNMLEEFCKPSNAPHLNRIRLQVFPERRVDAGVFEKINGFLRGYKDPELTFFALEAVMKDELAKTGSLSTYYLQRVAAFAALQGDIANTVRVAKLIDARTMAREQIIGQNDPWTLVARIVQETGNPELERQILNGLCPHAPHLELQRVDLNFRDGSVNHAMNGLQRIVERGKIGDVQALSGATFSRHLPEGLAGSARMALQQGDSRTLSQIAQQLVAADQGLVRWEVSNALSSKPVGAGRHRASSDIATPIGALLNSVDATPAPDQTLQLSSLC